MVDATASSIDVTANANSEASAAFADSDAEADVALDLDVGVVIDSGALLDAAVARRLGEDPEASPRWAHLSARFDMATKLEVSFWQMGLNP